MREKIQHFRHSKLTFFANLKGATYGQMYEGMYYQESVSPVLALGAENQIQLLTLIFPSLFMRLIFPSVPTHSGFPTPSRCLLSVFSLESLPW